VTRLYLVIPIRLKANCSPPFNGHTPRLTALTTKQARGVIAVTAGVQAKAHIIGQDQYRRAIPSPVAYLCLINCTHGHLQTVSVLRRGISHPPLFVNAAPEVGALRVLAVVSIAGKVKASNISAMQLGGRDALKNSFHSLQRKIVAQQAHSMSSTVLDICVWV
jgi:hypothetical protein